MDSFVEARRELLRAKMGGLPTPIQASREVSPRERDHLLSEAKDLYVNEVEWERLTDEESLDDGPVAELAFPGFLAFVRGLLLVNAMEDSLSPADPRPEVVEDVLAYLDGRILEVAAGSDPESPSWELAMTRRLVDLVLYRLYDLSPEQVTRVEEQEVH